MTTTSFYNGNSYSKSDSYYEEPEHDDHLTAEDYDAREYYRNGWNESIYDRQSYWYWAPESASVVSPLNQTTNA